jgi:hypothetical protein
LFFEGYYKNYYIKICPVCKQSNTKLYINYDIIEALYTFENKDDEDMEKRLTADYFLGYLIFENHRVCYVARDCKNPNFEDNLNGLIGVLKRENLMPLAQEEWANTYGEKIKKLQEQNIKSRTIQIVKISKILDIKYIKKR